MTPDISVIVPHLNQPEALGRLLDSLDAQRPGDAAFEVIVADNGSRTPLPVSITGRAGVRVVAEHRPGPGPARNAGVAVARGAILAFTDCDCIAAPDWIAAIARHFATPDAAPVIGGDIAIALRGPRPDPIEAFEAIYGYRQQMYIARDRYAATCNLAMRRAAFDAVGGFGGLDIAEDRDWGLRAHAQGWTMAFVPDMRISTPARASFAELARKWDRVIAHDFAAATDRLSWGVRAAAVAASPLAEGPRLVRSRRVRGARARLLAAAVMVRLRFYRARRMVQLALGRDARTMAEGWRRG
jgi:glycosyltransferase involved in cell wall biosynthesis